ncbi:hypothetical protein ACPV34_18415 [Photobacterium damselae]|uniref:hypothetical protein n=1 Tax=Photobacterium damselae TaxID=38293 RepID=UPI004068B93F
MSVTFVTIDGIVRPIQSSRKPPTARSASTSYQVKAGKTHCRLYYRWEKFCNSDI